MNHHSPLPCGYCGKVGQCVTKSGKVRGRHTEALRTDDLWDEALEAMDSRDLDLALITLIELERITS